jgi:hypothetical protein
MELPVSPIEKIQNQRTYLSKPQRQEGWWIIIEGILFGLQPHSRDYIQESQMSSISSA